MTQKWLAVVGIGEDGLLGLTPIAQFLVEQAQVIVGGDRHLAMLPPGDQREKIYWTSPIESSINEILNRRGRSVCVLASGDPLNYGIGTTLLRRVAIEEMTIIPAPSAFSLACARLGWSLTEVESLSLCGRSPALLHVALYPGARLLVLSEDSHTPATVAQLLTEQGWGESQITVLQRMGGDDEHVTTGRAATWAEQDLVSLNFADLNTLAIALPIQSTPRSLSRLAGIPDTAYHHDGQLTKREVRAVTLAALAPQPGQLLWDVGAGCGSIGIEWMRSHGRCRAVAIEQNSDRLQMIADNATALGTPNLKLVSGQAPAALHDLPEPDAIFIGGGVTAAEMIETCWNALRSGGRLVINAVTVESEMVILQWHSQLGGELSRIAIQRAEPIGKFLGWKAMAPVTQWRVMKR
ncbi:MAG: precorrin-6y C5,15-methyltransferase (decarboxylating) subunit CbiE [Timaviella obliquedivisa GSE-PSE-MK23-08B]|jgi:precorrin-6Y C5,15-methyltransferase (decarboxylating)|nr:precorrin-6y C5,15-methyltransferase (decarboxylating) subunit CbiE [Timaviella obliquedivisa GSE-PSE-MK23-08B]